MMSWLAERFWSGFMRKSIVDRALCAFLYGMLSNGNIATIL